jgi:hypothetical protein
MFTCGFFRSNFSFAISPRSLEGLRDLSLIQRRRAETLHFASTETLHFVGSNPARVFS